MTTLTFPAWRDLLRTAIQQQVPDLTEVELDALLSSLVSGIGLAVVNEALLRQRSGGEARIERLYCTSHPAQWFHFDLVSKQELLTQMEAGSGLPEESCALALRVLEERLREMGEDSGCRVHLERLGEFAWGGKGLGYLQLEADLAVPGPAR